MTNLSVIENKISDIRRYLRILAAYKKYSKDKIENDITLRGAVERYLYLATQAVIDLAEAVIAFKNFRKPGTLAECFQILQEEDILDSLTAAKMIKLVGFRNVIAHEYTKIDYEIVYDALQHRLSDINEFIATIRRFLRLS